MITTAPFATTLRLRALRYVDSHLLSAFAHVFRPPFLVLVYFAMHESCIVKVPSLYRSFLASRDWIPFVICC